MMVIYTSGTTGRPKGAVHVHGGFLVKIAEECAFQLDVGPDDRFMWVTDMGWIMGPLEVVGAGALGRDAGVSARARPTTPARAGCGSMVERHRIIVLGVSPTLIRALAPHGDDAVTGPRPLLAADPGARPASRGTPSPTGGCSRSAARAAARSSTCPAAPRWARASSRRCR